MGKLRKDIQGKQMEVDHQNVKLVAIMTQIMESIIMTSMVMVIKIPTLVLQSILAQIMIQSMSQSQNIQ